MKAVTKNFKKPLGEVDKAVKICYTLTTKGGNVI